MDIQLSDHFTYKKLFLFVYPSVVMMIFSSLYGVVDSLFISNFVGKTPLASINLIMPFIMILTGIGFMIGIGGSALVAKTLGEGNNKDANRYFAMMIYLTLISSIIISIVGIIFIRPISYMLGATDEMINDCVTYGRLVLMFNVAFMLGNVFQSFFITAEKPMIGLIVVVISGLTNIALDTIFIVVLDLGVEGAAFATGISECVGGIIPLVYFIRPNSSQLKLVKTKLDLKILIKACANGSSEMMDNVSFSLICILYNFQLLRIVGENGVVAYSVVMNVQFIFMAIFIGYTIGSSPIISYHYGANNSAELNNMLKKSVILMTISGIIMALLAQVLAYPSAHIFVGYDSELLDMTVHALQIFSISFVLSGLNIFLSTFFTALNNGGISATISFVRTLVFQSLLVLILPIFLGLTGIWWASVIAEVLSFIVAAMFLILKRKQYNYM